MGQNRVGIGTVLLIMAYGVPDSKVHGANMGPTWVLSALDGPHCGPMNFAIRGVIYYRNASTNRVLIDSLDGSSYDQRLIITLNNDDLLSIWPLPTNFWEIYFEICKISFRKMHLKMSFALLESKMA